MNKPQLTSTDRVTNENGIELKPGDSHYRAYVGPPKKYDLIAAMQFNLLTSLGLRQDHYLLDIGCGSLRAGRLFIPYLLPRHYYGIEPAQWLIEKGIENEVGADQIRIKQPTFSNVSNFNLRVFNQHFDYLVAQSIFSHASITQIEHCLQEAAKIMSPEAIFAATIVEGECNYSGEDWVYPECVHYTFEFFSTLAARAGLVCSKLDCTHPNGQTWVSMKLNSAIPISKISSSLAKSSKTSNSNLPNKSIISLLLKIIRKLTGSQKRFK